MRELFMTFLEFLRAPSTSRYVGHTEPHPEVEEAARKLEVEIAALDALVREVERKYAAKH